MRGRVSRPPAIGVPSIVPSARPSAPAVGAAHPWPFIVMLLMAIAAAQVWLVHDMKWLASGLYGGDHVYQMGCIRSIMASRDPLASCSVSGALPGYLPLYGTLIAALASVTGLDALPAMLLGSVLLRVLSAFVVFRVVARLTDRTTGFAIACLWTAIHPELIVKYTEFTTGVLVPLYYLVLIRYVERPQAGRALVLGLSLAVLGYAHAVAFIGGTAIAALTVLAAAVWRRGPRGVAGELGVALRHGAIVLAAASLALGYWYRPIFVYHGHTSLHFTEWNGEVDFSTAGRRLAWAWQSVREAFSFEDLPLALLALLILAGLARFAAVRDRRRFAPAMLATAATFLWMFHYLATVPLLHTHFVPIYVRWMLWGFARFLPAAIAVAWLLGPRRSPAAARAIQTLALAAGLTAVATEARALHEDPAMAQARSPMGPGVADLTRWATVHAGPEDVALSTNELSFAWAAVTGRRTLVARRGQNDAFIDMDVRNRDAALILYGSDDTLRTRLLRQYDVRYVFWNTDWFNSEFSTDASGDTLVRDPLFYFRNDGYDRQLEAAGVRFTHLYTWVDPAMRGPDVPRFDLTVVLWRNYQRSGQPWRDDLARRLERVWSYPPGPPFAAALYRVRDAAEPPRR